MTLHKVRYNSASCALITPHAPAFRAGQFSLRRQQNMNWARKLKAEDKDNRLQISLFADFARDDHHRYLNCLHEIRKAQILAERMKNYEFTVMDRVMGVLHR
jgi:hypothetical protein